MVALLAICYGALGIVIGSQALSPYSGSGESLDALEAVFKGGGWTGVALLGIGWCVVGLTVTIVAGRRHSKGKLATGLILPLLVALAIHHYGMEPPWKPYRFTGFCIWVPSHTTPSQAEKSTTLDIGSGVVLSLREANIEELMVGDEEAFANYFNVLVTFPDSTRGLKSYLIRSKAGPERGIVLSADIDRYSERRLLDQVALLVREATSSCTTGNRI